jgi:hypothetical protein
VLGGIFFKESTRRHIQAVFESQDIIRRQKLVQIPAAFIEAGNATRAGEPECLLGCDGCDIGFHFRILDDGAAGCQPKMCGSVLWLSRFNHDIWCIIKQINQYIEQGKKSRGDLESLESVGPKVLDKKNAG